MRGVKAASGTRKFATIVFSDIESSTVLLDRLGDTGFLRLLAWHRQHRAQRRRGASGLCREVAGRRLHARISIGDICYAREPGDTRLDWSGIRGLPIRIRAGLHSCEAIRQSDNFCGKTVLIAARIGAVALGGEILASDLAYQLTRSLGTFTFGVPRTATLKGPDGDFELRPVVN